MISADDKQSKTRRRAVMTSVIMEKPNRPLRRADASILKRVNAETLQAFEYGLLGEIPEKLRPQPKVPVRGRPTDLAITKPTGFLSSCLPTLPDSPISEKFPSPDDDSGSPLKKTFSFRDKLSRISFLRKDKEKNEKTKWKTIVEDEKTLDPISTEADTMEHAKRSNRRFWMFRNKDSLQRQKNMRPLYTRSKSFEFLPRALEEDEKRIRDKFENDKLLTKNSWSYVAGSKDILQYGSESVSNLSSPYDNEDVFLKSFKDTGYNDSSLSTVSSSCLTINIMKRDSVQDLLEEFDKAVDMFSENYMSDSEPYTKSINELSVPEKRKSSSFRVLTSPKILPASKVNEISEDFKSELSKVLSRKRVSAPPRSPRRGSVTDWFVLEDHLSSVVDAEENKYRKAQKRNSKPVRRMSSTKYWITPEECSVYSREQRPPFVIPRITQFRPPRREIRTPQYVAHSYPEEKLVDASTAVKFEKLDSPSSEKGRVEIERHFSKAISDSPPFTRINNRWAGSTENLLNIRRPNHMNLPASSSGDSLDVDIREKDVSIGRRNRKSRSMVATKNRPRSPVPAPRLTLQPLTEAQVVQEGPVKRTRYAVGGKKGKKNWLDCYLVLTNTALLFYKDHKTYVASRESKRAGTPPSPGGAGAARAELVLPLQNAYLVPCIKVHTSRYTRSLSLTVGYDQYLLQDETEDGAKRWLRSIYNVIYKLGPPVLSDIQPSLLDMKHYQSSNTDLESLGRTPPAVRHANKNKPKVGGSSNEDLSDSTEVSIQKSHVRSRLRKFFAKRPSMEVLVKKGIYKDEPVFGRNLEEVCPPTSPRVPDFVVACIRQIESTEENMCTDGLYRASGNLSQVQKIRLEIDQNNQGVIENNTDIHVLTGSLKLFFRELKEPLIPYTVFDRVLSASSIRPRESKIKEFRDIVQSLPQCNRDTLKFLLEHLLRVTKYSDHNRMHTANLAIVFGPTLLWAPAEQAHNIAIDCIQQNNVVDIMLTEFKDIFEEKGKRKA